METQTIEKSVISKQVDNAKIHPDLKVGDKAIMGEEYHNSVEVIIDFISPPGYLAKVTEVKSGQKWTIASSLLSPVKKK